MPRSSQAAALPRALLLIYVVLFVMSNTYRLLYPADGHVAPDQEIVEVAPLASEATRNEQVRIAYRDLGPRDAPPIMLIHGTPAPGMAVMPLARELASELRVIVPDMPGFGGSTRRLDDYSFGAHAIYVQRLLDGLGLASVHVVAYSQGGGVALSLASEAPERVKSLVMISTIGVQELELLGDYHLNQSVYVAQLTVLRAVEWLVPHFGTLDTAILNTAYGRNLTDSDQRPLRNVLRRHKGPMLLVHGEDDGFVPPAAAMEHHRLVPQSELIFLPGGHLLTISDAALVAEPTLHFLRRVEDGLATTRSAADPQRIRRAEEPFQKHNSVEYRGIALFTVLLLLAIATYVSEDLACISAGLLVARGALDFFPATAACVLGIYTGDLAIFIGGRLLGARMVTRAPVRWLVSAYDIEKSREWFSRRGAAVIFISRFIPGTRVPSCFAAGTLGMSVWRFSAYFLLAAIVWTPLIVATSYFVGGRLFDVFQAYGKNSVAIMAGIAVVLWVTIKILKPLINRGGGLASRERWQPFRDRRF